ncbi:hypothetical protein M9H77_29660 [Catharanthus roseus]|uniref:Uncharacterized protein n=1 Tax=Catharanthus roseus TaxID=4058 RepID=A0ACB9ZX97_CATRO|nr:hypothetical protein M9H77_29660 [Catharanthus roseus]
MDPGPIVSGFSHQYRKEPKPLNAWVYGALFFIGSSLEFKSRRRSWGDFDVNWLDMQEHQGVVTRAKAKQLKSHNDQIEQEKFQGLNFDMVGSPSAQAGKLPPIYGNVLTSALESNPSAQENSYQLVSEDPPFEVLDDQTNTYKKITQNSTSTPFGEESRNSQHDNPLRLIMQELQSLRDEMRDIRRDVSNLSNQQRKVSPHGSLNATTLRSNGPFNCSRTTEFHQPPHFDEEFINLLTVVKEEVLEEACLDTLKKFQDHKLGMESHYMMIMNMFHLLPTVEETKVTKP